MLISPYTHTRPSSGPAVLKFDPQRFHAAIATLDVDLRRAGLPPGGPFGRWSSSDSASRTSSMATIRWEPGSSRNAGLDATAAASEAQDARMARFSPVESVVSATTSRG